MSHGFTEYFIKSYIFSIYRTCMLKSKKNESSKFKSTISEIYYHNEAANLD